MGFLFFLTYMDNWMSMFSVVRIYTSPKKRLEPTNHPIDKGQSFAMLSLQGVQSTITSGQSTASMVGLTYLDVATENKS